MHITQQRTVCKRAYLGERADCESYAARMLRNGRKLRKSTTGIAGQVSAMSAPDCTRSPTDVAALVHGARSATGF